MLGVKTALGAALVVTVVGAVAAALADDWDLFVLFAFVLICQLGIAVALLGPRRLTSLRRDLARWTAERAAVTGEPESRIVDRAVAAYRDELFSPDE